MGTLSNSLMASKPHAECVPASAARNGSKNCPKCGLINPATAQRCDCGWDFEAPAAHRFAVTLPSGESRFYDCAADLHDDIAQGLIPRSSPARRVVPGGNGKSDPKWSTMDRVANRDSKLQLLYQPVWSYTMRYFGYGCLAGIVLKGIDTTATMFAVDGGLGLLWLGVVGSLLIAKKWPLAPVIVIVVSLQIGVRCNLFLAVLATMLVGAAFGGPLGMVVGTIVGYMRRSRLVAAPDAVPEGRKPWVLGGVVPCLFLAMWIPSYVWFNIKLLGWLQ